MTSSPEKRQPLPKQPLSKPKLHSRPLNPSAHVADLQLKSAKLAAQGSEGGNAEEEEIPVIEFDSSKAPQPFLEGEDALERAEDAFARTFRVLGEQRSHPLIH
ncbi:hypothetical protein PABG_01030 [Paracoccidioides brasiliensis Pb03]|nr:hypothetical protein PABG_01030 [Paracoccidioides brasiliensis Pb03]